jgi:preprotein translocase subunit SecF
MRIFSRVPSIDFMAQRKRMLVVSAVLSLAALASLFTRGLNLGIDFKGGVLVEVVYPQAEALEPVRDALAKAGYADAVLQYFGSGSDILIRLQPQAGATSASISSKVLDALSASAGAGGDAAGAKVQLRRIEFVGPQVGSELTEDGVIALAVAFGAIFLYVMFRFEWKFSLGSIVALTHDLIMTAGFLSAVREEFDLTVLAGILAMLGYSNNETIVIFDRIRENLVNLRKQPVETVINLSINQTLLRSIITHCTVLMVLFALFLFGGKSVHGFALAMIVGVVVATYSSIYISSGVTVLAGIKREDLLPSETAESARKSRNGDGAVV